MPFLNIFLKTLGLLAGFTTFIIIFALFISLLTNSTQNVELIKGDESSENIIVTFDLSGPIINNINNSFISNIIEYIKPANVLEIITEIKKLNPKILIIKINSPGGTVNATNTLEKIITDFKKENKVEVYFYSDEILASGGYWVATSGDKIFANYGSIVGSIGVSGPIWYYYDKPISLSTGILGEKIETQNGIQIFNQNAGNSKDLYNPFRKPTKKELNHLQNIVEEIYDNFLIKVSKSRRIEVNRLENEIGALIFSSTQAKDFLLIDDVFDFNELINYAVNEKKFNDFKLFKYHSDKNIFNEYLYSFFSVRHDQICNKLNTNFVSLLPIYLNRC